MIFADLIASSHSYLSEFDRDRYPVCFLEFQNRAEPFFDTLDELAPEDAVPTLILDLENSRKQLSGRAARNAAFLDKQVLALFFSPAAEKHSVKALRFAEELQTQWNRKYPRNTYSSGSYDSIIRGFRATFLGFPLPETER